MFSFFTTLKALFRPPRPSSRPLSRADRAARGVGRPHAPAAPKRAVSQHLLDAARQQPDALLRAYKSSMRGLNSAQIPALRRRHGENRLTRSRREPLPLRLLRAFLNPFSVVLLLLAAISFITDYLLAAAGEKDLTAVLIVGGMVLISGTLRFVQEARSGDAVARLESLVNTTIDVLRDGRGGERPISELVPGDVVRLAAGDMIPADLRILEAKDLFISQSSLTGESEPVEKFAGLPDASPEAPASPPQSPLDCADLAFMGSNVVSDSALTLVLAAIIILGINASAYMAEIFRAGIQAIDYGQMEAARSLGLPYSRAMIRVVLPQAIRTMIPSIINQFIITLKDTSILSVIGFPELVNTAKNVVANSFMSFQTWGIVAVMYLIVITILSKVAKIVERRLNRGRK